MPFGVLVVGLVDVIVVGVVDVIVVGVVDMIVVWVIPTVTAMLVAWAAAGSCCDLLPEMFSPRGLPLDLLIWKIVSLDHI